MRAVLMSPLVVKKIELLLVNRSFLQFDITVDKINLLLQFNIIALTVF